MRTKYGFCALLILAASQAGLAQKTEGPKRLKKRVAVFVFDDKTDRSWHWWNNKGVGEGMSDMLVTALVKSGNYRVVERQELDALLREQDLGASGAVTPESAAEIGKMLGVELAVMGAVTEFGYSQSKTGGRVKGLGLGVQSQSATVAVDCRLVNTSTGEIVAADNVRKEKSAKGLKVDTRKVDFSTQKAFDESLVGKAAREAVNAVVTLIDRNAARVPWQAKVVAERNGQVFINVGAASGVQNGDRFVVYRKGEALVDPDTGLALGSIDTKLGEIEVVNATIGGGKAAQCRILSGSGFQRGDLVRIE